MHVSTTYLHPDRTELDEVIYPAPVDHQRLLDCVSAIDQPKNQILVQQYETIPFILLSLLSWRLSVEFRYYRVNS